MYYLKQRSVKLFDYFQTTVTILSLNKLFFKVHECVLIVDVQEIIINQKWNRTMTSFPLFSLKGPFKSLQKMELREAFGMNIF